MPMEPAHAEPLVAEQSFPLVIPRAPLGPPMMTGLLAGFAVVLLSGMQGTGPLVAGLFTALVVGTVSMRRLGRSLPDRARLSSTALEMVRGDRVLRRVDFSRLAEVNQLPTPSGPLLYLADDKQTVLLAKGQLVQVRRWDELSEGILDAVTKADPTGTRARNAVRTGKLRDEISHQPVRGVPVLMALIGLSSLLGFRALQALSGRPFPREELGALTSALGGAEAWRLFAYPFQQESGFQLMLVLAGLLWLGSWLEKLLGWERVLVAFASGTAAAGAVWVLTDTPIPLVGGFPGIFGLFGAMGAVALIGRRTLPRALLPRTGFWVMTLVYVLLYLLLLPALLSEAVGADPLRLLTLWPTLASKAAATVAGFLATSALLAGCELPARPSDRKLAAPFAWMSGAALVIGLVGGVTHMRAKHPFDDEIIARKLLDLPSDVVTAQAQNYLAYRMLTAPGADIDTIDIGIRLAERAVDGSERKSPEILDTLAVARHRQNDNEAALELLDEALQLVPSDPDNWLRRVLERRVKDVKAGGPLSPDMDLFR